MSRPRRCKEVNFVLESADYSNLVHTSRRMSLEMIFLCLVRMYVHSMDSNVLWTMTLRRWRRASKTSKDIINTVTGLDLEARMAQLAQIGHVDNNEAVERFYSVSLVSTTRTYTVHTRSLTRALHLPTPAHMPA